MKTKTPYIIGIGGPSCAGKSLLTDSLASRLEHKTTTILRLDSYYKDLSHIDLNHRHLQNFDTPESIDINLLENHLENLSQNKPINKPIYDYSTHTRSGKFEHIHPTDFIIVEGIFALHFKNLRRYYNLSVYIEIKMDIACIRRIKRDTIERGRTELSVREQFENTVIPMAEKYIIPSKDHADLILGGETSINDHTEKVCALLEKENLI